MFHLKSHHKVKLLKACREPPGITEETAIVDMYSLLPYQENRKTGCLRIHHRTNHPGRDRHDW